MGIFLAELLSKLLVILVEAYEVGIFVLEVLDLSLSKLVLAFEAEVLFDQ